MNSKSAGTIFLLATNFITDGFGVLSDAVQEGVDYAVLESARKLNSNEYNLHPQLGYISINQKLGTKHNRSHLLLLHFQHAHLTKPLSKTTTS